MSKRARKNRARKRRSSATTTIPEAAKRLNIGRNQAYDAARKGEIPAFRVGRRWIVPTAALDQMLSGKAT